MNVVEQDFLIGAGIMAGALFIQHAPIEAYQGLALFTIIAFAVIHWAIKQIKKSAMKPQKGYKYYTMREAKDIRREAQAHYPHYVDEGLERMKAEFEEKWSKK